MKCLEFVNKREFKNGVVYALRTHDGLLIETTDTFLPRATKDSLLKNDNFVRDGNFGSRSDRWMIGVSVMHGCPVGCKFCATGSMKKFRNLTGDEIFEQVEFVAGRNKEKFSDAFEHKINYTRMGEPFLNIHSVRSAIEMIENKYRGTHHYISTIGVKGSDFSFVKGGITLQISVHSLIDERRDWLIPFRNKMTLKELGLIRTDSNLKTTLNMTLVDESDFDIEKLANMFDKEKFFIKLSPINRNEISIKNNLGQGCINGESL